MKQHRNMKKILLSMSLAVILVSTLYMSNLFAASNVNSSASAASVTLGDINGDGYIDSLDFSLLKMYLLHVTTFTPEMSEAADVNRDGEVNAIDFSQIKMYLLKIIKSFTGSDSWDWAGIIGTGQSLSVGANACPAVTTSQLYHNLKLSLGSLTGWPLDTNSSQLSMVPLTEPIRNYAASYPGPYPGNIYGETPHTVMADQITSMSLSDSGKDYITVHTVVGESGQGYEALKKGATDTGYVGRAYLATLFEVKAIKRLADSAGKTYGVGAVVITHGETDCGSTAYENNLHQLWQDYNQDICAITGQSQKIQLFTSQQHSCPANGTSIGTLAQWKVGMDYPGNMVCTGPKYQYSYTSEGVHLNAAGYDLLGEKIGEVYYERVVLGHDWQPLQPISVQKTSSKTIAVKFHVPVGPLVWDATMPAPNQNNSLTAWKNGKGFEVYTSGGTKVNISSVEISGDSVIITTANDLPTSDLKVGYAFTADNTMRPNGTFRWGLLRDSDPFKGRTTGIAQPNYCVAFEMPVQ